MTLMQRTIRALVTGALIGALFATLTAVSSTEPDADLADTRPGRAVVLEVDGPIGPATGDFIVRGIEGAEESGAVLVILRLNTPGGLSASMRDIIRKILASRVPVATFVSPPGSRAASAGTYIMYASHVAAMSPATNLGSATPVSLSPGGLGGDRPADKESDDIARDGERADDENDEARDRKASREDDPAATKPGTAMERKAINDAAAYIKGLAELRGRNEAWAERAVREAVNLTASDALEQNVIDYVAKDVDDLLAQLHGRKVSIDEKEVTLETDGLAVEVVEPDWRTRVLSILTDPNVAYVLMLAGIYGLFFELSNPGALFPGVLGAICLVLAFYAFQVLPVNYAGLALILLGIAFIAGEAFMPSFGVLGIGGAVAFVIGSLILMKTEAEAYQLSMPVIVAVTAVTALFIFTIVTLAIRQRGKPVVSGREQMVGGTGEATDDFAAGSGTVLIHGEHWTARSHGSVERGQKVRVRAMHGLTLEVEPIEVEK